jgi:hypothetical protein
MSSSPLFKNVNYKTFKTVVLSLVLYGCDTCPLTSKEELTFITFGDRVLRKYLETRNNLYFFPDIIGVIKSTRTRAVVQHAWQR